MATTKTLNVLNIVKALIVRASLCLHTTLTIWRVTVTKQSQMYWLMSCALVPFFVEGLYTTIHRKGLEFLRFTPCFFFYLCATVPGVWLLELDKTDKYLEGKEDELMVKSNSTEEDALPVPIDLNPNTWTILIEEMLLYLLIVNRWLLPRGRVTREQLSELLFAFIGIASDIMEFFSLFGETVVRKNKYLNYCVLSIWSLSVLQFTMTLTVTHQPKRAKKIKVIQDEPDEEAEKKKIRNECFAIFLSMTMQDVPFLVMRLYTIVTYDLITYSLVFFTAKNVLVIALLFYKVAVLCKKRHCPDPDPEDEENEEIVGGEENDNEEAGMKKKRTSFENGRLVGLDTNQPNADVFANVNEKKKKGKKYDDGKKKKSKNNDKNITDNKPNGNLRKESSTNSTGKPYVVPAPSSDNGKASSNGSNIGKSSPRGSIASSNKPAVRKVSTDSNKVHQMSSRPENGVDNFGWIKEDRAWSTAAAPMAESSTDSSEISRHNNPSSSVGVGGKKPKPDSVYNRKSSGGGFVSVLHIS